MVWIDSFELWWVPLRELMSDNSITDDSLDHNFKCLFYDQLQKNGMPQIFRLFTNYFKIS